MATAGSELQRVRRERKLSLSDVTKATKIQPWVLEALEADQLQNMMSPVYVKGFLATYAKFLRLEPEAIIAQVPWAKPDPEPVEATPPASPAIPVAVRWQWPSLDRRWVAAAVATAAMAALVVANPFRHLKLEWPRRVSQAPKPTTSPPPAAPKLASVIPPVAEPLSPPAPPPPPSVARSAPLELSVSALRTTWIRVRADGKLLSQQRLARGAKERWTAKKQLEVIIAKPSQVELQLNGTPISSFAIAHQGRLMITHHGITRLPDDAS
jgi:hypothetical protein